MNTQTVIRMGLHKFDLHLDFALISPIVVPFADGDIASPSAGKETEEVSVRANIVLGSDNTDALWIAELIFCAYCSGSIRGAVLADQQFNW